MAFTVYNSREKSAWVNFSDSGYGFDYIDGPDGLLVALTDSLIKKRSIKVSSVSGDEINANLQLDDTIITNGGILEDVSYKLVFPSTLAELKAMVRGEGNYREKNTPNTIAGKKQLVVIVEPTAHVLPPKEFSRGQDQRYSIRFEFDLRPTIMAYKGQIETSYSFTETTTTISENESGIQVVENMSSGDWIEIDNPSYGWLKVNVATPKQIIGRTEEGYSSYVVGDVVDTEYMSSVFQETINTGAGALEVVSGIYRKPGELVDILEKERVVIAKSIVNIQDTGGTTRTVELPRSVITKPKTKGGGWYKRTNTERYFQDNPGVEGDKIFYKSEIVKPGQSPMSFRISSTNHGLFVCVYESSDLDQYQEFAWFCAQRLVDNVTGTEVTGLNRKYPVNCLYSCSRDPKIFSEVPTFYTDQLGGLLNPPGSIQQPDGTTIINQDTEVLGYRNTPIYDVHGREYSVSDINTLNDFYVVPRQDPELRNVDEGISQRIWRYVVREIDVYKPSEIHYDATKHQVDSNAVINPLEQISITPENTYVISFPTGVTTQRYVYAKQEMDMIAFTSAGILAEGSLIDVTDYQDPKINSYGRIGDEPVSKTTNFTGAEFFKNPRKYVGMMSTLPNGGGMRVLVHVSGGEIPYSEGHTDYFD
jgi:hypothetical protein